MATYSLRQTFRYEYAEPIEDLNHRLIVIPPVRFVKDGQIDIRCEPPSN